MVIERASDNDGVSDGIAVREGSSDNEGASEGILVAGGTLETDGSCDKVGTADGVLERAVGPRVLEGLLEGEGVGTLELLPLVPLLTYGPPSP